MTDRRTFALIALGVLLVVVIGILAPSAYVRVVTSDRQYGRVAEVPSRPVALVLGAGMVGPGVQSRFQRERVDDAIALYRAGKVRTLLMSGLGAPGNDEVGAMSAYARAHGVPAAAIREDRGSRDTYASCARVQARYGYPDVVVVTQAWHLPRALWLCRELGVDAVGYGRSTWGERPWRTTVASGREVLATVKALWTIATR